MRNAWIVATADQTVRATEIATVAVPAATAPVATVRAAGASDGAVAAVEVAAVGSSWR
ncbi:MAG TPA: hypothetical protein VEC09_00425 [Actinomycetota bacterium]|nr:hypothetical protein [Actinomycetota bacterium]